MEVHVWKCSVTVMSVIENEVGEVECWSLIHQ
jgi:hypothetical protein